MRDRGRGGRRGDRPRTADLALVGLGANSDHALDLIDKIVREATCPVIALLHEHGRDVEQASKRGVFAHISDDDVVG